MSRSPASQSPPPVRSMPAPAQPVDDYQPPRRTLQQVLYGDQTFNEPPITLFSHRKAPARPPKNPGMHSFEAQRRKTTAKVRGAASRPAVDDARERIREALGDRQMTMSELYDAVSRHGSYTRKRITAVLSDMRKRGQLEHSEGMPPFRWWLARSAGQR